MRNNLSIVVSGALLCVVGIADFADAQMFGSRPLGRPLSRRPSPGGAGGMSQLDDVGTLQGNERFIRANRTAADFVGPDLRELERFIGALQASARAAAAANSLQGLRE